MATLREEWKRLDCTPEVDTTISFDGVPIVWDRRVHAFLDLYGDYEVAEGGLFLMDPPEASHRGNSVVCVGWPAKHIVIGFVGDSVKLLVPPAGERPMSSVKPYGCDDPPVWGPSPLTVARKRIARLEGALKRIADHARTPFGIAAELADIAECALKEDG